MVRLPRGPMPGRQMARSGSVQNKLLHILKIFLDQFCPSLPFVVDFFCLLFLINAWAGIVIAPPSRAQQALHKAWEQLGKFENRTLCKIRVWEQRLLLFMPNI